MDNATKAIMIGVGLFITVIIISAVLVVVNLGTGAMNSATNSMGDILGTLTTPQDWVGKKGISAETVNNLLTSVEQGKFSYPVTVVTNEFGTTTVRTPAGKGYVKDTTSDSLDGLGLNPTYARVGSTFVGLTTSKDVAGKAVDEMTYSAYVIQSRSNSQIGVLFVAESAAPKAE